MCRRDSWDTFVSDDSDSSVLLNRATQGLYPPGSTFKIFTTLEYIHENADYADYHFDCSGEYTVGTKTIHCHNNKRHGSEDLKTSFANSCNSSYASLGLTLDLEQFDDLCDQMLFNTALPTDFESSKSSFVLEPGDSDSAVMETSIGQGKTLVTPFHMALILSLIHIYREKSPAADAGRLYRTAEGKGKFKNIYRGGKGEGGISRPCAVLRLSLIHI